MDCASAYADEKCLTSTPSPTSTLSPIGPFPSRDAIVQMPGNGADGCTREKHANSEPEGEEQQPKTPRSWIGWIRYLMTSEKIAILPSSRKLEDYPLGFPRLAAFSASDNNFMVYRGFSYLHARVLFNRQDELCELERRLDKLDKRHDNDEDRCRLQSRKRDDIEAKKNNEEPHRGKIIDEIQEKLIAYDDLLAKARDLEAFQRPSRRDYRSVCAWINNLKPLLTQEADYITWRDDTITLRQGRECAGFDGFVEGMLQKMNCRLVQHLFSAKELQGKTDDECITYFCDARVNKFVDFIITTVVFILLVLPVVAMYHLTSIGRKADILQAIGVLIVFTLLFSAAMSLLTRARRHEIFAASAAYCAVLVVFISNFTSFAGGAVVA